jgi:hypothetical protein
MNKFEAIKAFGGHRNIMNGRCSECEALYCWNRKTSSVNHWKLVEQNKIACLRKGCRGILKHSRWFDEEEEAQLYTFAAR